MRLDRRRRPPNNRAMVDLLATTRTLCATVSLALITGCATIGSPPAGSMAENELAALYWAADSGNADAQFKLGQVYGQGAKGTVPDYDRALAWLSRSAENGDPRARRLYTQWTTGERARELVVAGRSALENGHEDYGRPLLERLAEAGVGEAAYALGRYFLNEDPAQPLRARQWLERGATAGDANARYLLGAMWAEGAIGRVDASAAAAYWQRCADQSHAMCQYGLGLLHFSGEGVARDVARGRKLIRLAAEQGYGRATRWLNRLERVCATQAESPPACR